ncbi:MAG: hypothetical protein RRY22_06190 [Bacilli bacterium]
METKTMGMRKTKIKSHKGIKLSLLKKWCKSTVNNKKLEMFELGFNESDKFQRIKIINE